MQSICCVCMHVCTDILKVLDVYIFEHTWYRYFVIIGIPESCQASAQTKLKCGDEWQASQDFYEVYKLFDSTSSSILLFHEWKMMLSVWAGWAIDLFDFFKKVWQKKQFAHPVKKNMASMDYVFYFNGFPSRCDIFYSIRLITRWCPAPQQLQPSKEILFHPSRALFLGWTAVERWDGYTCHNQPAMVPNSHCFLMVTRVENNFEVLQVFFKALLISWHYAVQYINVGEWYDYSSSHNGSGKWGPGRCV